MRMSLTVPALLAALVTAAPAGAADLLDTTLRADAAKARDCRVAHGATAAGVALTRVTAPADGYLSVALTAARGDWDVSAFDAKGRLVAGSAAYGSRELAQGFVRRGDELTVQACRRSGRAGTAAVTANLVAVDLGKTRRPIKLVEVATPTRDHVNRLANLGLDLTEHGDATTRSAVIYSAAEENLLRAAGLDFTVDIADLAAASRADRASEQAWAQSVQASVLPSGRTGYRRLVDFENEMKALVAAYPDLVKPITLPNESLEGRPVQGIEITPNVAAQDGKPVFLMTGVHHAREWPSAENPFEFAIELIRGYGSDERITSLLDRARVIVVPVVNVDGYNLSREAPDDGTLYEYKRKNCRMTPDPAAHPTGACAQMPEASGTGAGVDPNRNYGGDWGGPGASTLYADATYRGTGPFSEPEIDNVRKLISSRQVTTFITNHTQGSLILRPPGIAAFGTTIDEADYKALGDAMALHNKYTSQYSWQLYDTSGTAEAWSYYATGGYGFTFEIHTGNFHQAYQQAVVKEYEGPTARTGKGGNREAYFTALKSTVDTGRHSVLAGTAPAGTKLTLRKAFTTYTSRVQPLAPVAPWGEPLAVADVLTSTMTVPASGAFEWHTNPSTRPDVYGGRLPSGPTTPDITYTVPAGAENLRELTVVEGQDNAAIKVRADWPTQQAEDWSMELLRKEADGKLTVMARSAIGNRSFEEVESVHAGPGTYVVKLVPTRGRVASPTVTIDFVAPQPPEAWTLECEAPGQAKQTTEVVVGRGERAELGALCG